MNDKLRFFVGFRLSLAAGILIVLAFMASLNFAAAGKHTVMVSKWGKFEETVKSSVNYANPLVDATLTVTFTSPLGEKFKVYGFWDGGKSWTIRFSPDMPGRWRYQSTCSDAANKNLNNIAGEFLCIPTIGHSSFDHHGPLRLTRDRRHLEFEDHTPFFWLADSVWKGANLSSVDEWNFYTQTRAHQKFTAAQWYAISSASTEKGSPFVSLQPLTLNLNFFKKLDAKADVLNHAGILNVIVPLSEAAQGTNSLKDLPDDQAIVLLRYMAARWNANDVVLLLSFSGGEVERWKHIAHEVFGDISHPPIMIFTGEDYWAMQEFRKEPWLDIFGYQSGQDLTEESQEWLLAGPVSADWKLEPAHPFINIEPPYENEPGARSRVSPEAVRRAIYWSLLNTATAGVSYGGQGVWNWQVKEDERSSAKRYQSWPTWQKALFMPAAKQMETVADVFTSIDFAKLRPAQELIARQPGAGSPYHHIAAAGSVSHDLFVVYIPDGGTVDLNSKLLPRSPIASWINPRTGVRTPAAINSTSTRLSNPEAGDWLLWIQAAKR